MLLKQKNGLFKYNSSYITMKHSPPIILEEYDLTSCTIILMGSGGMGAKVSQ